MVVDSSTGYKSAVDSSAADVSAVESGEDKQKDNLAKAGTPEQTEVITDYPTHEIPDKLRIPYIERYNGNICVKNQQYE